MVEERKLPITIVLQTIAQEQLRVLEQQVDRLGDTLQRSLGKGVDQAEKFEQVSTKGVRKTVQETEKIGKVAESSFRKGTKAAEDFATRFVGPLDPVIRLLRNLGALTVLPFTLGISAVAKFATFTTGSVGNVISLFGRLGKAVFDSFLAVGTAGKTVVSSFATAFERINKVLGPTLAPIIESVKGVFSRAAEAGVSAFGGVRAGVTKALGDVTGILKQAFSSVVFQPFVSLFQKTIIPLFQTVGNVIGGIVEQIKAIGSALAVPLRVVASFLPVIGSLGNVLLSVLAIPLRIIQELGKTLLGVLNQIAEAAGRVGDAIGKAFSAVVGGAVIGVTVLAAGLFFLTKRLTQFDDQIIKTAQRVGVSVESLSGLALAAAQSNLDIRQVAIGLQQTSKLAADAAIGIGRATGVYKEFKISLQDGSGALKSATVLIGELADKFSELEDGPEKVQKAGRALGDEFGPRLIPLLNLGSKEIDRIIDRAVDLNTVITELEAEGIAKFANTLTEFTFGLRGLGRSLVSVFRPALDQLFQDLTNFTIRLRPQLEAGLRTLPQAIELIAPKIQKAFGLLFSGGEEAIALRAAVVDVLKSIGTGALNVAKQVGIAISNIFKAFGPAIGLFLEESKIRFSAGFDIIRDIASVKGEQIARALANNLAVGSKDLLDSAIDKILLLPSSRKIKLIEVDLTQVGEIEDLFRDVAEAADREGKRIGQDIKIRFSLVGDESLSKEQRQKLEDLLEEEGKTLTASFQVEVQGRIDTGILEENDQLQKRIELRAEQTSKKLKQVLADSSLDSSALFSEALLAAQKGIDAVLSSLGVGTGDVEKSLKALGDLTGVTAAFEKFHKIFTDQVAEQIKATEDLKAELKSPEGEGTFLDRFKGLDQVFEGTSLGADQIERLTNSVKELAIGSGTFEPGFLSELARAGRELEEAGLVDQIIKLTASLQTTQDQAQKLQIVQQIQALAAIKLEPKELIITAPQTQELNRIIGRINDALRDGIESEAVPGLIRDLEDLDRVSNDISVATNLGVVTNSLNELEKQVNASGIKVPKVFEELREKILALGPQLVVKIPAANLEEFRASLALLEGDVKGISATDLVVGVRKLNEALADNDVTKAIASNAKFLKDFKDNLEAAPLEKVEEFAANAQKIADQQAETNFFAGFAKQADDASLQFTKFGLIGQRIARDLETAFGSFFDGLITGEIKKLSDAFQKLGQDILRFISKALSEAFASQVTTGIGGLISLLAPKAAAQGGVVSTFAEGGVMEMAAGGVLGSSVGFTEKALDRAQSITPDALQRGGVAREPKLALFAEAGKAEAFVPLDDGKNIPVRVNFKGQAIVPLPGGRSIPVDLQDVRDALGRQSLTGRKGGATGAPSSLGGGGGGGAAPIGMQFGGVLEKRGPALRRALAAGGRVAASVAIPFLAAALAGPAGASERESAVAAPLERLESVEREAPSGDLLNLSPAPRSRPVAEDVGLAAERSPDPFTTSGSTTSVRGVEEVVRLLSVPTGPAQRGLDTAVRDEEKRGVDASSPLSILSAQRGAVVREPSLLLAGEGGSSEAIVPLQDGGIPVRFQGGGGGGQRQEAPSSPPQPIVIQFTIIANDTKGFDQLLASRQSIITKLVEEAAVTRQSTRQTLDVRR